MRWNAFVRAGAKLSPAAKARVAEINKELAGLFTTFNQNLLADETDYLLYLERLERTRALIGLYQGTPPSSPLT